MSKNTTINNQKNIIHECKIYTMVCRECGYKTYSTRKRDTFDKFPPSKVLYCPNCRTKSIFTVTKEETM